MVNSVISRTRQMWVFVLALVLLLAGSFLPLFEQLGISWTVGTIVAVAGYGIALAFIRCPDCGIRWFWKALLYAEMYGQLFKSPECPVCKKQFGDPSYAFDLCVDNFVGGGR